MKGKLVYKVKIARRKMVDGKETLTVSSATFHLSHVTHGRLHKNCEPLCDNRGAPIILGGSAPVASMQFINACGVWVKQQGLELWA